MSSIVSLLTYNCFGNIARILGCPRNITNDVNNSKFMSVHTRSSCQIDFGKKLSGRTRKMPSSFDYLAFCLFRTLEVGVWNLLESFVFLKACRPHQTLSGGTGKEKLVLHGASRSFLVCHLFPSCPE